MKVSRLIKLRIAKYVINIGSFVGVGVYGIFSELPASSPLYELSTKLSVNTNIIVPIVFTAFGLFSVLKDQVNDYFNLPKGVNTAVLLFILGFVAWLISYWMMIATGLYLVLTIINTFYFNPAITEEVEFKKATRQKQRLEGVK